MNRKVAVVTGGTRGLGKQIVKDLLTRDYYVYTNYANDTAAAEKAKKEFAIISKEIEIIKADQADRGAFKFFISRIQSRGNIHCIVCNTGMTLRKAAMEITDEEWEAVMQVAVNSHFYLIRDLYPLIQDDSRIIFIGSMMGILPHSTSLPYGVAKAAVHGLAKNLVKEFEGTGTTVNAIAPGFFETDWQKDKPQQIRDNILRKSAIKRFGDVQEISSAVNFCLDNQFVNGSVIEVSGGYCCK